jgi:hypothetical protein
LRGFDGGAVGFMIHVDSLSNPLIQVR